MDNLFSFAIEPLPQPGEDTIWTLLKAEIAKVVKADVKDGKGKAKLDSMVLPELPAEHIVRLAVRQIFDNVSEFYYWYFNPLDDRSADLKRAKATQVPERLHNLVGATVEDNLEAMREVGEIPAGRDIPGLQEILTDQLTDYIVSWQDWYWDQLREEVIDSYYESMAIYEDIYLDSDYGDLSNLPSGYLDGYSDVPYLSDEEDLTVGE